MYDYSYWHCIGLLNYNSMTVSIETKFNPSRGVMVRESHAGDDNPRWVVVAVFVCAVVRHSLVMRLWQAEVGIHKVNFIGIDNISTRTLLVDQTLQWHLDVWAILTLMDASHARTGGGITASEQTFSKRKEECRCTIAVFPIGKVSVVPFWSNHNIPTNWELFP